MKPLSELNEITNEYTLLEPSCWITVGKISVFIRQDESGVHVRLYPLYQEMEVLIDSAFAPRSK